DRSGQADLWLDYVADLGDGWNSTYTVARLLATEELKLDWDGETHATERGRILVMGGDQVYPVPNAAEYENRMIGPYRAALPCAPGEAPELFGGQQPGHGIGRVPPIAKVSHVVQPQIGLPGAVRNLGRLPRLQLPVVSVGAEHT
ncbi:MAG: hypothetical protein ACRDUV_09430, partial [Pseudonocardiaceae bacterium]